MGKVHKKETGCSEPDMIALDGVPGIASLPGGTAMAVLEQSPVGVCILKGNIIDWANPFLYRMTGHEPGSLEGKEARIFYPTLKEYERISRRLMDEVYQTGFGMADTRLFRKDKTAFDCRVWASRMDPEDSAKGVLITALDITEIRSAQIQRHQAQKMEAIGVLAGGISHDFNNLLMGIQGHLSLMRINVNQPKKMSRHIEQMSRLVETAAELTGRLLGFARGGKYQITALDINQVVTMALSIFEPTRAEITIKEKLTHSLYPVDGDHSQLEQVLLNLMVNASQAMIDGGTLTISTQNIMVKDSGKYRFTVSPGPYVEILLRDTGMGMNETIQRKIFDPFFSTKEAGDKKGRGLGLSTVFGIVKNHGGFITVESSPGKGSSFKVCLPASTPCEGSADVTAGDAETILIVDDEQDVLDVGKLFLEQLGYKPLLAPNGLEAVEMFKLYHDEVALVVLDLIMPDMDGKETFSALRKIAPDVKILVSTGLNVNRDVENMIQRGAHGLLQKPFSLDTFSKKIREIIDSESKVQ